VAVRSQRKTGDGLRKARCLLPWLGAPVQDLGPVIPGRNRIESSAQSGGQINESNCPNAKSSIQRLPTSTTKSAVSWRKHVQSPANAMHADEREVDDFEPIVARMLASM
jgi:hypothetical protein